MFSNRVLLNLRRLGMIVVNLLLVAAFCIACDSSTDAETKAAVEQMNQDLQQSIGQLNAELQESVDQLNTDLQHSIEDLQKDIPDVSRQREPGTQKWEYNLGVVLYDDVCVIEALAPYKDNAAVKDVVNMSGYSRRTLAVLGTFRVFVGELSECLRRTG